MIKLYFTDNEIDNLIREDVPYIDLTTTLLGIANQEGTLEFRVREDGVVACTEVVVRIFEKLGLKVIEYLPSGTFVEKGTMILKGEGKSHQLHMAWKVSLNVLEYCLGIATSAKRLVDEARKINPNIGIVSTRKSFPGTKRFVVKSAIAGGVLPHRLGISETVLVFKQHLCFMDGLAPLLGMMSQIKADGCEKKIIVEVENREDALNVAKAGADGIQFDKVSPDELKVFVENVREVNENITLIAAGGVNHTNAANYAGTGVDAIATSCIFHAKPLDIEAKMTKK